MGKHLADFLKAFGKLFFHGLIQFFDHFQQMCLGFFNVFVLSPEKFVTFSYFLVLFNGINVDVSQLSDGMGHFLFFLAANCCIGRFYFITTDFSGIIIGDFIIFPHIIHPGFQIVFQFFFSCQQLCLFFFQ